MDKPDALSAPEAPNVTWSMDFMADLLGDGRARRLQNILDNFNREGLGIEADFSLQAERVIRSLNRVIEWRGKPGAIRVDIGPEYVSEKLMKWTEKHGVTVQKVQADQPQRNAHTERYDRVRHWVRTNGAFNGSPRHEWRGQCMIESNKEDQDRATLWL